MEPSEMPPRPAQAERLLAGQTDLMDRYVHHLADTGVRHGLIGPRERPRLWERHILNCAAVADLIPQGATLADVGSGAGLPGMVLAIARPDVQVTLIEPLLRRVTWLETVLDDLALPNVSIRRARAEQLWDEVEADVVTSRAVARLEELARWSLPLLNPGGTMLALKGASAAEELNRSNDVLERLGASRSDIVECGGSLLGQPTIVIRILLGGAARRVSAHQRKPKPTSTGRRRKSSARRRRSRSNE